MDKRAEAILLVMAADAFDVMNWARRLGLKRDQQLNEVKEAFLKTLVEARASLVLEKD